MHVVSLELYLFRRFCWIIRLFIDKNGVWCIARDVSSPLYVRCVLTPLKVFFPLYSVFIITYCWKLLQPDRRRTCRHFPVGLCILCIHLTL